MLTLREVQKDNQIKLSKNGVIWIVSDCKKERILLRSRRSGAYKTYTSQSPKWSKQVWKI